MCDQEPSALAVQSLLQRTWQRTGFRVVVEDSKVLDHGGNAWGEKSIDRIRSTAGVLIQQLRMNIGHEIPAKHPLFSWAFCHASWLIDRFEAKANVTAYELIRGHSYRGKLCQFGEPLMCYVADTTKRKGDARWRQGFFLGNLSPMICTWFIVKEMWDSPDQWSLSTRTGVNIWVFTEHWWCNHGRLEDALAFSNFQSSQAKTKQTHLWYLKPCLQNLGSSFLLVAVFFVFGAKKTMARRSPTWGSGSRIMQEYSTGSNSMLLKLLIPKPPGFAGGSNMGEQRLGKATRKGEE